MQKVYPILLCGGQGLRLWPLSKLNYPKQFIKIFGDKTLYQEAVSRIDNSKYIDFQSPISITNEDFRFIVKEQLQEICKEIDNIILEPFPKNTAPAVLAAAFYTMQLDPNAILLILPTDHYMQNVNEFHKSISIGIENLSDEKVISFGIKPTRPETGFGYIKTASSKNTIEKSLCFIEKPSLKDAKHYLSQKNYLWNSGIYLLKAKDLISIFKKHFSELIDPVFLSVKNGKRDLGFFRLDQSSWKKCKEISLDYAVIDKLSNLFVVFHNGHWNDLGDWNSVWNEKNKDKDGVVKSNNVIAVDCKNSLLTSDNKKQKLVALGVEDIVAISHQNSIFIANRDRTQDIKKILSFQEKEESIIDYRPWGWYKILVDEDNFKVKQIFVKPEGRLSLQSHKHRSEHWTIVEGQAKVTIDKKISFISKSESIFIPQNVQHRVENVFEHPLIFIEVQIGAYLGEDDIIRFEDIYNRIK